MTCDCNLQITSLKFIPYEEIEELPLEFTNEFTEFYVHKNKTETWGQTKRDKYNCCDVYNISLHYIGSNELSSILFGPDGKITEEGKQKISEIQNQPSYTILAVRLNTLKLNKNNFEKVEFTDFNGKVYLEKIDSFFGNSGILIQKSKGQPLSLVV